MIGDRDLISSMAIQHLEGDGDFLLPSPDDFHVGEDDD